MASLRFVGLFVVVAGCKQLAGPSVATAQPDSPPFAPTSGAASSSIAQTRSGANVSRPVGGRVLAASGEICLKWEKPCGFAA